MMEISGKGLTRKEMLKLGLLGSAALFIPLERAARTRSDNRLRVLPTPFQDELPIPKPLSPARITPEADFYEITMKPGTADIIPGRPTTVWGYDGEFPGPTIAGRKDRRTVVTFTNELPVETSVHNHGAYVDGDSDGHPSDLVPPGGSKTYIYRNSENSRTQWYHDHAEHITASNVYMGLAGFYLLGDSFDDALPCPKEEFDVPLVIQDRLFDEDGSFLYPFGVNDNSTNGIEGDVVLVNGKAWPRMPVANRKYRLRILNGSNARVYQLALSTGQPITVIASDGGLLERPVQVRSLPIGPAERYEVIVDFSGVPVGSGKESQVILHNLRGDKSAARVMRFDVVRRARDDSTIPEILRGLDDQFDDTHQPADPSESVVTRRWVFKRQHGFWSINGKTWDRDRLDARPREGDVEIWEFVNNGGGWVHPIHTHLTGFRILSRNGRPPAAYEAGWKETAFLDHKDTVRVLIKWPKVPVETNGPFSRRYPLHCHVLEHEDHDMMLQYEVEPKA